MTRSIAALILCAGVMAACGDAPTDGGEGPATLAIVSGRAFTDTIDAVVPDLVVEVRDRDGDPLAGAVVQFTAVEPVGLGVAMPAAGPYQTQVAMLTDAAGRARARVVLGSRAGAAAVEVSVASLGLRDTARHTVLPGKPVSLGLEPRDTMLYAGGSFAVGGRAADRHGNPPADPVRFTVGNGHVSFSGGVVRGESVGRGYLLAQAGSLQDTLWVSVVPPGVLAAYDGAGLVVVNTDGSNLRILREGSSANSRIAGALPAWSPDGAELLYVSGQRIMATDGNGSVRTVLDGGGMLLEEEPVQYSSDGRWIYFARGREHWTPFTFWRVRPDGTGATQVSPARDWGLETWASPSPDGARVVYQTNRATNSPIAFTLRTLTLATGAVQALDVPGMSPRWSPTGEWIAFRRNDTENRLRLMRPDGTEVQPIRDLGAHPVFSWSPDGAWLAISGNQPRPGDPHRLGVFLVNVATGEQLPLSFSKVMLHPAWRP